MPYILPDGTGHPGHPGQSPGHCPARRPVDGPPRHEDRVGRHGPRGGCMVHLKDTKKMLAG